MIGQGKSYLRDRRFATRFLGRAPTWMWLGGTGIVAFVAWFLMAVGGEEAAGGQRTWFLWSGNVLLALFILTILFSVRKWSVKLPYFRDLGRASPKMADAAWAAIQKINTNIDRGAYGSDDEIQAAADAVLAKFRVNKIQRATVLSRRLPSGESKYVHIVKKDPLGRLEPWLEMHMGVGTVACVGVLLHANFIIRHPIGWLLLIGSAIVLITGVVGAFLYRIIPPILAKADVGIPFEEAGVARTTYQECIDGLVGTLDEATGGEIASHIAPTASQQTLEKRSETVMGGIARKNPEQAEVARDLLVLAGTRDTLGLTTSRARKLDFYMRVWKWIHIPVSLWLYFIVALHVWAVLWY